MVWLTWDGKNCPQFFISVWMYCVTAWMCWENAMEMCVATPDFAPAVRSVQCCCTVQFSAADLQPSPGDPPLMILMILTISRFRSSPARWDGGGSIPVSSGRSGQLASCLASARPAGHHPHHGQHPKADQENLPLLLKQACKCVKSNVSACMLSILIHLQSIHFTVPSQTEGRPQKTPIYFIVMHICCDSECGV